MAEDQTTPESPEDGTEDESPKKGGRLKSIVLILLGLGLGTGGGMFFVGPRFFGGPTEASAEAVDDGGHGEEEDAGDDDYGAPAGEGEEEGVGTMHTIANLIVNPAGSQGSRFLLVDLAVSLSSEDAVLELESLDAAARDELLLLLGSQTVQELSDISNREGIKEQITTIVTDLLSSGQVLDVFFPRFVIQ